MHTRVPGHPVGDSTSRSTALIVTQGRGLWRRRGLLGRRGSGCGVAEAPGWGSDRGPGRGWGGGGAAGAGVGVRPLDSEPHWQAARWACGGGRGGERA